MDWLNAAPGLVAALLLLFVPGAALGWVFGLRGFAIPALAPALSVSVIAVASTLAPLVHLGWGPVPVVITAAVAAAVLAVVRIVLRRSERPTPAVREPLERSRGERLLMAGVFALAVAVPAVLLARSLMYAFASPDSISQTFDNIFHLNALQYIKETGSASSLTIGKMSGTPYYPAAWHALVSLVGQVSGVSIPVSVNTTNLLIGALVWPFSVTYLVWRLFGRNPLAIVAGGALSAAFAAFPLLMIDFGVLYPNFLGLALLPACLGQLYFAMGFGAERTTNTPHAWVTLGAAVMGMTVAHPSALMALIVAAILPMFQAYARWVGPRLGGAGWRERPVVLPTVGVLFALAFIAALWRVLRPDPAAAFWPPTQTIAQAVGESLLASPVRFEPTWIVGAFIVMGIYRCIRRPGRRTALGLFIVFGALYVVVSGLPAGPIRSFLVGVWYNDSYRLAAMLPVAAIPVAVEGLLQAAEWLRGGYAAVRRGAKQLPDLMGAAGVARPWLGALGLAVVVVVLVGTTRGGQVQAESVAARGLYQVRPDSPLVSSDEMALLKRLDSHVPADAVIAGSPWTGASLAYALADRKTLQLHILSATSPAIDAVDQGLKDALTNPAACNAIKELHVQYVLDFGTQEVHGEHHPYQGVEDLQGSSAVTLVDQQGAARLYKVTACQS